MLLTHDDWLIQAQVKFGPPPSDFITYLKKIDYKDCMLKGDRFIFGVCEIL